MRNRILSGAVLLAVAFAAACGGPSQVSMGPTGTANPAFEGEVPEDALVTTSEPGQYGGMLVMAHESNPRSFNPITATETSSTDITNYLLNSALTAYNNAEQTDELELIKGHTVSEDGRVWDLNLRKGIRFSDGQPFDADDVLFTWNVITDPKVANSIKDLFQQSDGSFPVMEKTGEHSVRFTLKEPNAAFFSSLNNIYVLPEHKYGDAFRRGEFMNTLGLDSKPEDVVGLGPYRLKEYSADQRILLERNPYYWKVDQKGQRLPYIDRVVLRVVPDFNASLLAFKNGETDMLKQVRVEDVETLKQAQQSSDFTLFPLGTSFNVNYVTFNQNTGTSPDGKPLIEPHKLEWFRNKKFRQAISYAIDREGLAKTVFHGQGTPVYSITTPANKAWYDDQAIVKYPYNPEKAKQLLSEIGIQDRNGDGVLEDAKGNPIEFTLQTNVENSTRVNIANYIKDNLSKVGVKVNLQPVPFNELITKMRDSYNWESIVLGWQTGVPPDPTQMQNVIRSSGESHTWFPNQKQPSTPGEAKMDELLRRNATTLDMAERKRTFSELLGIWSDEMYEIDLVASDFFSAAKNRFGNLKPTALPPYTYWNVEELYLTK